MDELVPIDPAEIHWALNRPRQHQTPIPKVGDIVYYRHHEWGELTRATVLAVPDPAEHPTDRYLWQVVTDARRRPVVDGAGRRLMTPHPDPWPSLTLATDWGPRRTKEARVRGSAGWLPLDWQTRYRPGGRPT